MLELIALLLFRSCRFPELTTRRERARPSERSPLIGARRPASQSEASSRFSRVFRCVRYAASSAVLVSRDRPASRARLVHRKVKMLRAKESCRACRECRKTPIGRSSRVVDQRGCIRVCSPSIRSRISSDEIARRAERSVRTASRRISPSVFASVLARRTRASAEYPARKR